MQCDQAQCDEAVVTYWDAGRWWNVRGLASWDADTAIAFASFREAELIGRRVAQRLGVLHLVRYSAASAGRYTGSVLDGCARTRSDGCSSTSCKGRKTL